MSDQPDSDSIYKAPTSDTTVAPSDNLLAAYIGPRNSDYYLSKFEKFAAGSGVMSWNWPAFFLSSIWVLYRKMWMWAAVYWLALPIGLTVLELILASAIGAANASMFYLVSYVVIAFVLTPLFANYLYYRHAQGKVDSLASSSNSPEQQAVDLARAGGTSNIVWIMIPLMIFLIGILAAIAIPAYQDYTIRAQVSEGLGISSGAKAAVTASYGTHGELPYDNASAGLPEPEGISGTYVQSVEVHEGDIYITYGGNSHALLQNSTLVLSPYQDGNAINWECYSDEIANKHLPAACRS